jgi:fructose-1-phosphate kinase PfkB-like protein
LMSQLLENINFLYLYIKSYKSNHHLTIRIDRSNEILVQKLSYLLNIIKPNPCILENTFNYNYIN